MDRKWLTLAAFIVLAGVFAAEGETIDLSNPSEASCGDSGNIVDFTCNIMKTLLTLGPMIAIIALVLAGITYVYANVFVTADQRGRYHTLATSLALGAIILLALVGGAGAISSAGSKLLTTG
ncbi:MAG: hypothetical protein PHF60_03685 [Candidatus ainarchaeum sp.]|nr:hypothetical protein [Candidatus ainarchaeum sp.]